MPLGPQVEKRLLIPSWCHGGILPVFTLCHTFTSEAPVGPGVWKHSQGPGCPHLCTNSVLFAEEMSQDGLLAAA